MRNHKLSISIFTCGLVAMTVQAAHNSVCGEGRAYMPNEMHDERFETMDDDSDAFIDFVRVASGSGSLNLRMADAETLGASDWAVGTLNQAGTRGGRR